MTPAIEFEHVSKRYRLGLVTARTLSEDFERWWEMKVRRREDPLSKVTAQGSQQRGGCVWALKDISFQVEPGDVVGIIGQNGAGKSTLLKLLSRITAPTEGQIRTRGRVASLLEVGTGFHPELTGRDNIYMSGAVHGLSRREIDRRFDEIVDFSGCEQYIDTPVKRYSSGMYVRLGFAVAAHLEPDILVVDEVLAVGDAQFRAKAMGKMKEVSGEKGRTVLFVSHNMGSIKQLCGSCILLDHGRMAEYGATEDVVGHYLQAVMPESGPSSEWRCAEALPARPFQVLAARVVDADGRASQSFSCDESFAIEADVVLRGVTPSIIGRLEFLSAVDESVVWTSQSNDLADTSFNELPSRRDCTTTVRIEVPARTLAAGDYLLDLTFAGRGVARMQRLDHCHAFARVSLHDWTTPLSDRRAGCLSTILPWEIRG